MTQDRLAPPGDGAGALRIAGGGQAIDLRLLAVWNGEGALVGGNRTHATLLHVRDRPDVDVMTRMRALAGYSTLRFH